MRVARPAAALAVVASLAATGVASTTALAATKPKPVCHLVVDPAGDATPQPPIPSDDSLDVVSGDLASNAKKVTAVIRLKDLGATSPTQVSGRNYFFLFSLRNADYPVYFSYREDVTGGAFEWGDLEPGAGGVGTYTKMGSAAGVVDVAHSQIRITVPVADVRSLGKIAPGSKVTGMQISTTAVVGVLVFDVDTAQTAKSYVAGTASCVVPGA